jgi:hypothetical protein
MSAAAAAHKKKKKKRNKKKSDNAKEAISATPDSQQQQQQPQLLSLFSSPPSASTTNTSTITTPTADDNDDDDESLDLNNLVFEQPLPLKVYYGLQGALAQKPKSRVKTRRHQTHEQEHKYHVAEMLAHGFTHQDIASMNRDQYHMFVQKKQEANQDDPFAEAAARVKHAPNALQLHAKLKSTLKNIRSKGASLEKPEVKREILQQMQNLKSSALSQGMVVRKKHKHLHAQVSTMMQHLNSNRPANELEAAMFS